MSPERHGTAQYFFWQDDGALLGLPSNAVEALCTIAGHTVGGVVALPAQPDPETALAALDSLKRRLTSAGVEAAFSGLTVKDGSNDKRVPTLVVDRITTGRSGDVPAPFRVVALMQVFNEGDVLDATLSWLIRQGVDVWVLDNWSTDASFEIALSHRGRGVINVERFPSDGPQRHCAHRDVLTRKEILSARLDADWFILADADEIRTPPWPGIDLREALFRIGRAGFNAVDYTTVVFPPVDDDFEPGADPELYFRRFEFGAHPSDFVRIGTWASCRGPAMFASSGGHSVAFDGRSVFPYKFLLKHYVIRSQSHGERKVFRERLGRWDPVERATGWHTHYDHLSPEHQFVKPPRTLRKFEPEDFNERFLAERLTGLGALASTALLTSKG